ncbi:MAG: DNA adenine methylase [Polyangiales bacterium]
MPRTVSAAKAAAVLARANQGKVRSGGRRPKGFGPVPFLKWAGGKGQLLRAILSRLPLEIQGEYIEPFVGGGAVFFELARLGRIQRARLRDRNPDLVNTYRSVRDSLSDVIRALKHHKNEEEYYYAIRATDPKTLSDPERAARTIYMNKVGYNGLYRVNASGLFNVPFGRYKNPTICDEEGLRAASSALGKADIDVSDFEETCESAQAGDVVYLDPPYLPVSKTANFTSYAQDRFGEEEHRRLAETFKRLVDRGAVPLLSNSDTKLSRELYRGYKIDTVEATRAINSKVEGRGVVREVLVSHLRVRR